MSTAVWVLGSWVIGSMFLALMVGGLLRRLGDRYDAPALVTGSSKQPADVSQIEDHATAS